MKNEIKLGGCGRAESFPGATANLPIILFLVFIAVVGIAMVPIIVIAQVVPQSIEPSNATNQSKTEVVQNENLTAVASPATKR